MKKVLLTLMILISGMIFTSCNAIDQLGFTKTTIKIYNGEEYTEQDIINLSDNNKIDVPTKEGYYLKGVFDETEGGTKFFNGIGDTVTPWSRKDSLDLYCQWGNLSEIEYQSNVITRGDSGSYVYFVFENLSPDVLSAIRSNPQRRVYVTVHYSIKGSSYFATQFTFSLYAKADGVEYGETSVMIGDEWEQRVTTISIIGEGFDDDELKIYFESNNSSLVANEQVHIDDISVEISF